MILAIVFFFGNSAAAWRQLLRRAFQISAVSQFSSQIVENET
jgi:hypothetical protein